MTGRLADEQAGIFVMSVSVFDHPVLSGLLGQDDVAVCFEITAEIKALLTFEARLAEAEAQCDVIPRESAAAIATACGAFNPDIKALRRATATDGVIVPELVRQLRQSIADEHAQYIHFGATSQDAIDTGLMLRLKNILLILDASLGRVIERLSDLEAVYGTQILMGRTRMQRALPVTVAHRLRAWRVPLEKHQKNLADLGGHLLAVQFGGAVGTLDQLGTKGGAVRHELAKLLKLNDPQGSWHTDRTAVIELANWLSSVTAVLGKMGADIALMALNELDEVCLSGGGGSSAMPHKKNPVKAELLVTLGRFNAMNISGMHQTQIHELERSGSSWSLEWMILPQMTMAAAASLRIAEELLMSVESF